MRSGCFCLRPARGASHRPEAHREQTGLHVTDSSNGASPEPPPVRAVSPADVRRTESGRVIKQKAEARLQAIREASTGLHVLGGQIVPCAGLDRLQALGSGEVASFRFPAAVQHSSGRPQAKRILQPVAVPSTDCKQEKTLLQLLTPSRKSLKSGSPEPASVCKSILEASARRLQQHEQAAAASHATAQMAVVQRFSDAYLLAVSKGDQQWANATQIAASFSPDAILKTQDKQTFYGKPAVLKRLNSGAATCRLHCMTVLQCCKDKNCWCCRCWHAIEAFRQWQKCKYAKTSYIRSYQS